MGNKTLTLKELQEVELAIMKSFHNFCEKHNLRYYLGGGTLIGAIRHKGFIPWDDDIDVMMPRPDYMKFLELAQDGMIDEFYKIDCCYSNPNALSACARIFDTRTELEFENFIIPFKLGCWIDIFPIDGLHPNEKKRKLQFKELRFFKDLYLCSITKFGGKRRSKLATVLQYALLPVLPILRLFKNQQYTRKIDKISRKYDYNTSEYVGVVEGRAVEKEAMKKSHMEPAFLVDFEGEKFYSMANYDEYLTNLYGDYMKLPPEDQRVSRHEINVRWKDEVEDR